MKRSQRLLAGLSAGALLCTVAAAVPLATQASAGGDQGARASSAPAVSASTKVSIRVEGAKSTLIGQTALSIGSEEIDKDGKPADTCTGATAAVALEEATKGDWTGSYSSGLGYSVVGIEGESHPFSSAYYWSLWIDGKPATTGICDAKLKAGDSVLFFPQCSKEKASQCPPGTFDPAVLEMSGPAQAKAAGSFAVTVKKLSNLTGKPSAGAGVTLKAGGQTFKTNSAGVAHVRLARAGSYRIVASAPDSVRDELTVAVP